MYDNAWSTTILHGHHCYQDSQYGHHDGYLDGQYGEDGWWDGHQVEPDAHQSQDG